MWAYLRRLGQALYVPDDMPLEEATAKRKTVRTATFKWCEGLFKVFGWLGALVLVDLYRDRSGYGAFWIVEIVGVVSLFTMALTHVLFPILEELERSSLSPSRLRDRLITVAGLVVVIGLLFVVVDVTRIMADKIAYVTACIPSRYEPNRTASGSCAQNAVVKHSTWPHWLVF